MRAVNIAAIVSALIATAPVSAAADQIISESFDVTIPNSTVPDGLQPMAPFDSTPFPLFAPSTGTLKSVNITVSGAVTVVSLIADPDVGILLRGEGMILDSEIVGSGTTNIKLSGNDQNALYLGTGNAIVVLLVGSGDPTPNASLISSDSLLSGVVTYTYALPTLAIPETPTWAEMLVGFASLGFAARHAKRKARIRI